MWIAYAKLFSDSYDIQHWHTACVERNQLESNCYVVYLVRFSICVYIKPPTILSTHIMVKQWLHQNCLIADKFL